MQYIYLTFLLLLTAVLSSVITSSMPSMKAFYRRLKTRIFKPSTRKQIAYLQYQIDELTNVLNYDRERTFRVEDAIQESKREMKEFESKYFNREKNFKQRVKEEVRNYLKELQQ